jgi:hypothetical protein
LSIAPDDVCEWVDVRQHLDPRITCGVDRRLSNWTMELQKPQTRLGTQIICPSPGRRRNREKRIKLVTAKIQATLNDCAATMVKRSASTC